MKSSGFLGVLLFAVGAYVLAQNAISTAATVVPNGYIRAENGEFSITDDVLCSYSSVRGGTGVRQCFRLASGEWKPNSPPQMTFPVPPNYLDFAPCDPLNQLNISVQHLEIASLLPRSAAVKQVIETDKIAVVVYSNSPRQTVNYPLRLAMLTKQSSVWRRGKDVAVGNDGNFCGLRLMPKQDEAVALVYVDEVAGSGDYRTINSFRLTW